MMTNLANYRIVRLWSGTVSFFVTAWGLVLSAGRWYPSLLRLACGQVREGTSASHGFSFIVAGGRFGLPPKFFESRLTSK
jgi:hypothetical protein